MSDKHETRLQQKIREIDETPIQWRIGGIVFVAVVMYAVTFGIPLPEPLTPVVTLSEIAGPREIGTVMPIILIGTWGIGLYAGHVMHKIVGVDPA